MSWKDLDEDTKRKMANEWLFELYEGVRKKFPQLSEEDLRPMMETHLVNMRSGFEDAMKKRGRSDALVEQHEYLKLVIKLHREGEARRRKGHK